MDQLLPFDRRPSFELRIELRIRGSHQNPSVHRSNNSHSRPHLIIRQNTECPQTRGVVR